jgi:hypothetical protein
MGFTLKRGFQGFSLNPEQLPKGRVHLPFPIFQFLPVLSMNMTTSIDSFDKFKLFSGVADESISTKRYFPQTEGVRTCCRLWQRSVHLQAFGVSRETYYQWKRAYSAHGEKGLINSRPCPENPRLRTPEFIEEKIIYLRRNYHFGQVRISWYLARYHDIRISAGGFTRY